MPSCTPHRPATRMRTGEAVGQAHERASQRWGLWRQARGGAEEMAQTSARLLTTRVAFKGPGLQVNGLEAVPEGLWLSDQQDNRTYLVSYEGKVLTSFPSPARNASGTSFGAGSVWIASNVRPSMIYRHDPATGHCLAGFHLPNADTGGVHGIQWRPYGPDDAVPAPPEAKPELHPTAAGGKPNAGPGVSGTLWV